MVTGTLPYLAQERSLADSAVRDKALFDNAFGTLALAVTQAKVIEALLKLGRRGGVEWSAAVALELLLAKSWGTDVDARLWESFSPARPFAEGPVLGELAGAEMAFAAFPTDASTPVPPPWVLLALAKGLPLQTVDHRGVIATWESHAGAFPHAHVFTAVCGNGDASRCVGHDSWTLAAHMAFRALGESGEVRRKLAAGWMLTGHVRPDGSLGNVALSGKLTIHSRRTWMFPPGMANELERHPEFLANRHLPANAQAAWDTITGAPIVEGGDVDWPRNAEALHSFTSGAWQPVVAATLLAMPRRLTLWHSAQQVSADSAQEIMRLFEDGFWLSTAPRVTVKPVRSDSVRCAKDAVEQALSGDLGTGRPVLFNITQGNRVMALAVQELARSHSNLWLIYRDLDAADFEFTLIRFENGHAKVQTLRDTSPHRRSLAARMLPREFWDTIFSRGTPRITRAEAIRDQLGGTEAGKKIDFSPELRAA